MKILHLVPGSGGTFYCQNCLRDHLLIRALRRQGHDVILAPLYLPMYGGATAAETNAPLFFGGISVYVREKIPLLRTMPEWMIRLLNAPFLLRQAAKRESSTNAAELGAMTLSMLEGPQGNQTQEFDRFLEWLRAQEKPDVIHISNALLLGFAPALREALDAAIVCSLQDEEPWVSAMGAPYDGLCWAVMTRQGRHVSRFVATSRWYASRMRERLSLAPTQVQVVYPGVEAPDAMPDLQSNDPPTIGYLSRLNPAQGFEELVESFLVLKKEPELKALRLRATGGVTPADAAFVDGIEKRLTAAGVADAADIRREFNAAPEADFFGGLTVMSAPSREGEAFGMHIIEAMARGIPVVQPRVAAYPEIIGESGGGLLYDPEDKAGLTNALRSILTDAARVRTMGQQGYAHAREHFSVERMARDMIELYTEALKTA
ncbi:MAG TPA: glycosyltransferase [Candidatus Hydrogenedentes bacterium]|nr:glycosyltransferase [Candidatus Hydrogenedentota bacterium]